MSAKSTSRCPKARAASPALSHPCLRQRAEGNLDRELSNNKQAVAQPVSPPDPGAVGPPQQHLYTVGLGPAAFRPTTLRRHRTTPQSPAPEFFKAYRESITWFSENGRTQSPDKLPVRPRNEFPPGIPQRVALQQSPPPLRRRLNLAKLKMLRATRNPFREPPASPNHWQEHTATGTMEAEPGQDFLP